METQGGYLGLGDLNGARFELPGTTIAATLHGGELVAGGLARTRALVDDELVVRTADDRHFRAQVTKLDSLDRSERFAVLVDGVSVCAPGDEGMFVAGHWDDTGAHAIEGDELTYACMSGVIAKCVDWGYAPWLVGAEVHQSCTRLARADYCGDGHPWTLDGTVIDAYDGLGVQTRVGNVVRPDCFAELPTCTSLEAATELGAVIANDSAHVAIAACN